MATKKTSKTERVTPTELAEFTESLKKNRSVARKKAQKKASSRATRPGCIDDPPQMSLPGMADIWRAMPNHLARSSLFAPVARGRKRRKEGEVIPSRGDAEIRFWGPQLDEAQADVWMQALFEAGRTPVGEKILINRADFLRSIGRKTGQFEYKWLFNTMVALQGSILIAFQVRRDGSKTRIGQCDESLSMISGFSHDKAAGTYVLRIDERWSDFFGKNSYSLIDWTKRKQFGVQQDMAKSLQRLIATSRTAKQYYELAWLKERLAVTSELKGFRRNLKKAFVELERLEIIADARIEKSGAGREQAAWTRLGVGKLPALPPA